MDIHKPKPVHSIREFLNEIVVIITGVLIALGLEQAVESWHQHDEVAEARETLRYELSFNLRSWQVSLDNAACIRGNMAAVMAMVEKRDVAGVKAMAGASAWQSLGLGTRATSSTAWETVNTSGLLAHMPGQERLHYANAYMAMDLERSLRREISETGLAMIAAARVYDGSPEASRDLLKQASAINLYYERRPATYRQRMGEVAGTLKLFPAKATANEQKASWNCAPYRASGA